MPYIRYIHRLFQSNQSALIESINEVISKFRAAGYTPTLRQIYYKLVAAALIPNNLRSYKRLGYLVNEGRLAGAIDWAGVEDRMRGLASIEHFSTVSESLETNAARFAIDKWADQPYRPEVWVEKDAVSNIAENVCSKLDIPFFACRGYTSQSEMWRAGQRFRGHIARKQMPLIIHLGDHDPSGIDMTRDIQDRLGLFLLKNGNPFPIERIALTMDQVEEYQCPPNPSKVTDARYAGYRDVHGENCWELDALDPAVLEKLITDEVLLYRDNAKWEAMVEIENEMRARYSRVAAHETAWEENKDALTKWADETVGEFYGMDS